MQSKPFLFFKSEVKTHTMRSSFPWTLFQSIRERRVILKEYFKFMFKFSQSIFWFWINTYYSIRFFCCPNCKRALNTQPSQSDSNDAGDANTIHLRPSSHQSNSITLSSTSEPPTPGPGPGIRQQKTRRGHYDRNVVISRQQIPLANKRTVGNSCDIRRSTRIKKSVEMINYGKIKCPTCKRKFTEIFPKAFYEGFISCSTNCYNRAFNP